MIDEGRDVFELQIVCPSELLPLSYVETKSGCWIKTGMANWSPKWPCIVTRGSHSAEMEDSHWLSSRWISPRKACEPLHGSWNRIQENWISQWLFSDPAICLVPFSAVACLAWNRRLQHWAIGAPKTQFNPMYIKQLPSTKKRTCYVSSAILNLTDIKSTGLAALCIHTTKTQEPNGIFATILKLWRFLELIGQCS